MYEILRHWKAQDFEHDDMLTCENDYPTGLQFQRLECKSFDKLKEVMGESYVINGREMNPNNNLNLKI